MANDDSQNAERGSPQDRMARLRFEIALLRQRLDDIEARKPAPLPEIPASPPAPSKGTSSTSTALSQVTGSALSAVPHELALQVPAAVMPTVNPPLSNNPPTPSSAITAMPAPPTAWTPARRARNGFDVALHLARRPGFCCCCLCLQPLDARRAKRIFAIVRSIKRAEKAAARRQASA